MSSTIKTTLKLCTIYLTLGMTPAVLLVLANFLASPARAWPLTTSQGAALMVLHILWGIASITIAARVAVPTAGAAARS